MSNSTAENVDCHVREKYPSCEGLPFYREHEGRRYCVLHFPGNSEKAADFQDAIEKKLVNKDFNFKGAFFPSGTMEFEGYEFVEADFSEVQFDGAANFRSAKFTGIETLFQRTKFSEWVSFESAEFNASLTHFHGAEFTNSAIFANTKFTGYEVHFYGVRFSGDYTTFANAKFRGEETDFGSAKFTGNQTRFQGAKFSSVITEFSSAKFNVRWLSFERAEFTGFWTSFQMTEFSGYRTSFEEAKFSGDTAFFQEAKFSAQGIAFEGTEFNCDNTEFRAVEFCGDWLSFEKAKFTGGRISFQMADFRSDVTYFANTSFRATIAIFSRATFWEEVVFFGAEDNTIFDQIWVLFHHVRIEKPELLTFNTVLLRPGWFVNTDVRKVNFTEVEWCGVLYESETFKHKIESFKRRVQAAGEILKQQLHKTVDEDELHRKPETRAIPDSKNCRHYLEWFRSYGSSLAHAWKCLTGTALDYEVEVLRDVLGVKSPYTLLAQACQRLAANAEENRNYAHASGFNYWAMDAQRKAKRASAFAAWRLIWWYWALSGYGESALRSGMWLIGILFSFALVYILVDYIPVQKYAFSAIWQAFWEATVYSLEVMSRQAGKLTCNCTRLRALVSVEGILGPVQVALFALALRRTFMRGKG